jgi:5'(3')-deoxyribonucleotidase
MKTIVFDIDGVLADFIAGFMRVAKEVVGRDLPYVDTLTHEHWDSFPGLTDEEVAGTWEYIRKYQGYEFWRTLTPIALYAEFMSIAALMLEGEEYRVYFATNRQTPDALAASTRWLAGQLSEDVLFLRVHVVITKRKGEFCRAVDADYYIDDKSENVDCAIWMTDKKVKAFVIDRPYNRGVYAPHSSSAKRVFSIAEFLEEVRNGR